MTTAAMPLAASRPTVSSADDRARHHRYTSSLTKEHTFTPLHVEGRIPDALRGTLYRNGPGLFESFGTPHDHSFVADGAMSAVRFEGGRALGAHRVIESLGLVKERAKKKPLYGANASKLRRLWNALSMDVKNSANTSVMLHQDRIYALFEAARPTELDAATLDTIGESDLGLPDLGAFSAHPHPVAAHRTTYGYGVRLGPKNAIDLFALPWEGKSRRIGRIPLERGVMLHDAAVTEKHFVFLVCPVEVVIWRALLGVGSFRDLWKWNPSRGTEVIVVPIDAPERVVRFRTDAFFYWHVANAFERGSEIVVDLVRYGDLSTLDQLGADGAPIVQGTPTRMVIDPANKKISGEALADLRVEFPTIDARVAGAEHHVTFFASESGPRTALVRMDREGIHRLDLDAGDRPSELIFVPSGEREGQGWALSLVFNARTETSHVVVLDAERFEDGPIARAFFDHHVPITFHGTFVPAR